ncbi:hypothetical protein BO82DRAFT_368356 [Aspergillus uvarum CBS 121591]|uniref:Rieske domain-containing protein n=1 Tax=Aspergillus uvarum CBS 121591 TaxID=1448315 RepID=A0A319DCK0_9EURO|nr:hypothetical protein BO82DRAFT_368356 [Aspergillus uvarum CBS 121591]PYH77582.1 hypothetical protein BO82DRAFT_368356 [Aspergillus uvarum CBS 121591]
MVLGCGYHGWSYNTTGALTKAPMFDDLPGFKKEANSLFEIHTKQDDAGFLFVNFDQSAEARNSPLPPAAKIGHPVMIYQTSQYLDSWTPRSDFNWKIMAPFGLLTTVYTKRGSPFWFLVSYSPDSAGQTTVRCEAYSVRKQHTPLDSDVKKNWGEQLRLKVQGFEQAYRKALRDGPNLGASVDGQAFIADQVDVHLEREVAEGKEIRPAAVQASNGATSAADKLNLTGDEVTWYDAPT